MRWLLVTASLALTLLLISSASAEIAPEHYANMQASAPEALTIDVVDVDVEWCLFRCENRDVVIKAKVVAVNRTASSLKVGDSLTLKYVHRDPPRGWVGPSPLPILSKGTTVAYLKRADAGHYVPAARGYSFDTVADDRTAKPEIKGEWEDGFFTAPGAPDPVMCEEDADCMGDTTLGEDGCCNEPTTIKAFSKDYRKWTSEWRKRSCEDVTCPPPPNPAQPADCYFQVRCVESACVNSCPKE